MQMTNDKQNISIREILYEKIDGKTANAILANISEAFAYDDRLHKEVDLIYDQNKYEAYKIAKESDVYNHLIITQGSLQKEIYCKRALGIILLDGDLIIKDELLNIIKKYYNKLYCAVHSKDGTLLTHYFYELLHKTTLPPVIKSNEYFALYTILQSVPEENINENQWEIINAIVKDVELSESRSMIYCDVNKLVESRKDKILSVLNRIEKNKGKYYSFEDIHNSNDEDARMIAAVNSIIFDFEKMSASNLLNSVELNKEDINEIILSYTMLYKDKNLERSSRVLFNGIIIKSLIKAYKNIKEEFFKNNKETLYMDLKGLEDTIEELENNYDDLKRKNDILDKQINTYKDNINSEVSKVKQQYNQEISYLNKKISKLEEEIDKQKQHKQEINELRDLLFSIDGNYKSDTMGFNLDDLILDKKVMIIGGTPEWRKRIKESHNRLYTLDGFNENFEKNIFIDVDFVFFYVGYMNHATYNKVISILSSKNIPFKYIGKTNIDLVIDEMIVELSRHKGK